jgi:hypothetical protein
LLAVIIGLVLSVASVPLASYSTPAVAVTLSNPAAPVISAYQMYQASPQAI